MGERQPRSVLFLDASNRRESRFAEILFNSVAERSGLSWRASSRGLALPSVAPKSPMDPSAVRALEALGIRALFDCARPPAPLAVEDLDRADRVIVLGGEALSARLGELFPGREEKPESWPIPDSADSLSLVERTVLELAAKLLGGKKTEPEPGPAASKPTREVPRGIVVKLSRETKGRRGKGVTIVSEVPLDEEGLEELAARLKQRCGTGGTVKDGRIEIQGDQRDRLAAELEALGYKVKKAGG